MTIDDDDAEVDEVMGIGGEGEGVASDSPFQAFAFNGAGTAVGVSREAKKEKQVEVKDTGGGARKRRRLTSTSSVQIQERAGDNGGEDKENQERLSQEKGDGDAVEEEKTEAEDVDGAVAAEAALMDDDDEDRPLTSLRAFLEAPTHAAAPNRSRKKVPPLITFPSHFVSEPSIHNRNVNRFLEREAHNDGVEADSSEGGHPTSSQAPSSSSTALDLTDDSLALPSSSFPAPKVKVKYTPLELQVLDIKRRHPDLIIFFEVGYKFRFFGADAEVAAKHLDIIAHPSSTASRMLSASIPTFRLLVHLKRLVEAGYKVGVVRQTESAAQKRINKDSGHFSRKLTEVYTKATMVNEVVADEKEGVGEGETASRYIMVLYEEPGVSNWTPPTSTSPYFDCGPVVVHIVAFDPITGSVVYDTFDDGFMRNELETRLIQLGPVEVLMPDSGRWLSRNTWKLLQGWSERREGKEVVRLERLDAKKFPFDFARATSTVTDYYTNTPSSSSSESSPSTSSASSSTASTSLAFALSLPKGPFVCLSVLLSYLQAFELTSAFSLSSNFRPFLNTRYMLLNNTCLLNLEILSSSSSDQKRGSLLWLLSHTKTSFGSRLLRHWISHPLLSLDAINDRLDAVTALMDSSNEWVQAVASLLSSLPDLERGLSRIHYSTCKPAEFHLLLQAYERILTTLPSPSSVTSSRIRHLLSSIDRPEISDVLTFFLSSLNADALNADDKSNFYTDPSLFPAIAERKAAINQRQQHMRALLQSIRQLLGPGYGDLEYKSVLTNHYMIEVNNNPKDLQKVPRSWNKMNSTKAKIRYHTPDILEGWMQLTRAEELLAEESDRSWRAFLQRFTESYALFRHIINVLSELDCLLALATTSLTLGYVRPELVANERMLDIGEFRHPMTEQMISEAYVPNSVRMEEGKEEMLIITGPNMGGKSSTIRAIALTIVMAQIGCYVPASHCRLSVFDGIYTRMGARDSLHTGKSTFLVELAETQQMLTAATPRSLLVFDELGRGTSTNDGVAIAYACMQWVLEQVKAFTLLVTHYPQLARLTESFPRTVGVYHMSYMSEQRGEEKREEKEETMEQDEGQGVVDSSAGDDGDVNVTFMYSLTRGVAPRSFGLNVARLAHVNEEVVRRAAEIAAKMRGGRGGSVESPNGTLDEGQHNATHRVPLLLCRVSTLLSRGSALIELTADGVCFRSAVVSCWGCCVGSQCADSWMS